MLSLLEIKNVALIDHAKIDFCSGLNVLSGETGSGKSVIIESLNFVLGAKAEKSLIKYGESECFVRAEFCDLKNPLIDELLGEFEIEPEDTLIITRKLNDQGKSTVKINGVSVTVSMLKRLTAYLVDVHGQSEHFYLLKESNQLALIDKLGKDDIAIIKNKVKDRYTEFKLVKDEIDKLGGSEKDRETRLDIINYQINEIESIDLKDGEEEELISLKQRLNNIEKIQSAFAVVKNSIDDEGGISDILYNAIRSSLSVSGLDDKYSEVSDKLSEISANLDDISSTVGDFIEELNDTDLDVNYIEDRLDKIKILKRKYGSNYQEICEFLEEITKERDVLLNFNDNYKALLDKEQVIKDNLYDACYELSIARRGVCNSLAGNIVNELKELGITKGKFEVKFNDIPEKTQFNGATSNGFDQIEFLFSANPGQPLKPLSQVISGGEMSRFMLAVKSQTSITNDISTFIFDEIDAGISGGVAKVVAKKFAKIASGVQVIAITHLPQISVMADRNVLIFKTESLDSTLTNVKILSSEERTDEIIRLIGGEKDSQTAKLHAHELIDEANTFKNSL